VLEILGRVPGNWNESKHCPSCEAYYSISSAKVLFLKQECVRIQQRLVGNLSSQRGTWVWLWRILFSKNLWRWLRWGIQLSWRGAGCRRRVVYYRHTLRLSRPPSRNTKLSVSDWITLEEGSVPGCIILHPDSHKFACNRGRFVLRLRIIQDSGEDCITQNC